MSFKQNFTREEFNIFIHGHSETNNLSCSIKNNKFKISLYDENDVKTHCFDGEFNDETKE